MTGAAMSAGSRWALRDVAKTGVELRRTAMVGAAVIVAVAIYLGTHDHSSSRSQLLGDLSILGFSVFATVACVRAARRPSPLARGWAFMAVAMSVWLFGEVMYAYYGVTRDHHYPFPSVADLGFLGYSAPALAALLAFNRSTVWRGAGLRTLLDALVIAMGALFVSWATVLHQAHDSAAGLGLLGAGVSWRTRSWTCPSARWCSRSVCGPLPARACTGSCSEVGCSPSR